MTNEEEEELRETEEATRKCQAFLKDLEGRKEDLQVLGMNLQDATDDMNDALRAVEKAFYDARVRPGWVPVPSSVGADHALVWDGTHMLYDDGRQRMTLLSTSRQRRKDCADLMEALVKELTRKR